MARRTIRGQSQRVGIGMACLALLGGGFHQIKAQLLMARQAGQRRVLAVQRKVRFGVVVKPTIGSQW